MTTTATNAFTPTPANLATPGSTSGASLTQGGALPNITTTQGQATTLPQFYQDYLNKLTTQGTAALGSMYSAPNTANQELRCLVLSIYSGNPDKIEEAL